MPHISVLKEDEDPSEVFTLTPCEGCDAGCNLKLKQFHCPICPALKFKPNPDIEAVHKHLQCHFTGMIKIIYMRGYKMTMCYQACQSPEIQGGLGHYHCPFCPSIAAKKAGIVKHSSRCNASFSPLLLQKSPGVEHSQQRSKLTLDSQNLLESPQLCDFNMKLKDHRYHSTPLTMEINRLSEPGRDKALSLNRRSNSKRKTNESALDGSFLFSQDTNEEAEKKDPYSLIHAYRNSGDSSEFETIFQDMTNNEDTDGKLSWIACMSECASLLDRKCDKLIIAFLKIPLFTSPEVANAANNFFRTLIGHHNYYAYHILKMLFHHLIPDVKKGHDELLISAGSISKEEDAAYERVISSIIIINSDIPMTQDNLVGLTRKIMPYFQSHVHKHAVYARNLLLLASRLPRLRVAVLEVIISNMITIDVHTPRSELAEEEFEEEEENDSSDEEDDVFDMEVEDGGGKPVDTTMKNSSEDLPLDTCQLPKAMTHKTGNTLDVLMAIMLQYVHDISHGVQKPRIPEHLYRTNVEGNAKLEQFDECQPGKICPSNFDSKRMGGCECGGLKHNVDSLKHLYNDLKVIFSNIILRTHASSHVQFLLFYMLSLRPGLLAFFADFLINKKFKDPNCSPCIRKNAMAYIGSLLARGKHVSIIDVHACLESIRDWCNDYLDTQERTPERNYEDIALHGAFYCACQTLFYVFTFRYKQYTENKKTLSMARSLNLERYIHSQLNPLHICSQPVVNNFAAVAHHFQIAYCYTVIENNKRLGIPTANVEDCVDPISTLDSFFPFDPYLLSRSKLYIQNHYREFEGLPEGITSSGTGMDVDDERLKTFITPDSYDSMYGISPGFVRFTEESVYN